jgi:hydrophobic/amphiphilic exporter-1 (mainly G- bacteria), HAE1 family
LRKRGMKRNDALIEAGPVRLRPILMTTLTVILGNMPIALGLGSGSEMRSPMSVAVIGGLTLSLLLTLIMIPCTYTIFDDISNFFSRLLGRKPVEFAVESAEETSGPGEPPSAMK